MAIKKKGWLEIPINKLAKAPWNYKNDDEEKARALAANIKLNGQIENIIVRLLETGFYEVVNGNHRYDTFITLGTKTVVCFNLGKISQAQAMRVAIETNETRFDRDNVKLASIIRELNVDISLEELETTMPFSTEELDAMVKLGDFDFSNFNEPPSGAGTGPKTVTCPHCGETFEL